MLMKLTAEVNTDICEVNIYHLSDDCEPGDCGCGTWVGNFAFEVVDKDVVIHSWTIDNYDSRILKVGFNKFVQDYTRPNSIERVFVERSLSDRIWELLGWSVVGKCEMLERTATVCRG